MPNPETAVPFPQSSDQPDQAGKFSISEDWLAVVVGLALLALALGGLIPEGLVP